MKLSKESLELDRMSLAEAICTGLEYGGWLNRSETSWILVTRIRIPHHCIAVWRSTVLLEEE